MVNKSAVGQTDEAFDMVVERGKVREFARATKSAEPRVSRRPRRRSRRRRSWCRRCSGRRPAPRGRGQKLQLDMRRVLDGGREFVFHGPPPEGGHEADGADPRRGHLREGRQAGRDDDVRGHGAGVPRRGGRPRGRDAVHRDRDRQAADGGLTTMVTTDVTWDDLDEGTDGRAARLRAAHPDRLRALPGRVG